MFEVGGVLAGGVDADVEVSLGVPAVQLIEALPGVFATLAGSEPYTERVLAGAPDLRVIARWGVGYDAIDLEAATRRRVMAVMAAGRA